jgi:hypothetical protein
MSTPTAPIAVSSPRLGAASAPEKSGGSRGKLLGGVAAVLVLGVAAGLLFTKYLGPETGGGVTNQVATPTPYNPIVKTTPEPIENFPTDEPIPQEPSSLTPIGEVVHITCSDVDCMEIKVAKVAFAAKYKDPAGYFDDTPAKGNIYMAVYVTYKATGPNASYNPFDWQYYVNDVAGQNYGTYTSNGPKPELSSGELPKGKSAAGWLIYEVSTSGRITIAYQPGANGAIFEVLLRAK